MRMLMLVKFPTDSFNAAIRRGGLAQTMKKILDDAKPEVAYFTERDGLRGGMFIVNLESQSDIPRLSEPWFLNFGASVEFRIAMTPEDLGRADLDALGKKWG